MLSLLRQKQLGPCSVAPSSSSVCCRKATDDTGDPTRRVLGFIQPILTRTYLAEHTSAEQIRLIVSNHALPLHSATKNLCDYSGPCATPGEL